MTGRGDVVTAAGGDAAAGRDGGKSGAERMRALRARRAAERETARRQGLSQSDRAAEARQVGLPLGAAGEALEPIGAGGKSGPKTGSVARHTAQFREAFLRRYRSPVIGMAELYSRPVHELAREIGCTALEALKLQMDCMDRVAPFVHSKMPTAVQLDGAPPVMVGIQVTAEKAAAMGVAPGAAGGGVPLEDAADVGTQAAEHWVRV